MTVDFLSQGWVCVEQKSRSSSRRNLASRKPSKSSIPTCASESELSQRTPSCSTSVSRSRSVNMLAANRLSIPRKQGMVSRILSEVSAPYSCYYELPEIPKVAPPPLEHQRKVSERLSKPQFSGLTEEEKAEFYRLCEEQMKDAPQVSAEDQQAYMEKLAQPQQPATPIKVKKEAEKMKKQQEELERRLRAKQYAKDERERNEQERAQWLAEREEQTHRRKQRPNSAPGNRNHQKDALIRMENGSWDSVLHGLNALEGKFDAERERVRGIKNPTTTSEPTLKKCRPRSATTSSVEKITSYGWECAPVLDELLWVFILSLQGAHALKSGERLEKILISDASTVIRKAKGVPRAPATMKRLVQCGPRLARLVMNCKTGEPAPELRHDLEACRDHLLRQIYVQSAIRGPLQTGKPENNT